MKTARLASPDVKDAVAAGERFLAQADPVMAQLLRAHGPCTLGRRKRDPFHVLAASIIGQQLSSKAADSIQARVEARVAADKHLKPEHFLQISAEELRACGLSNAKTRWLRSLAEAAIRGTLDFARLRKMDDTAALKALDDLPGIGPWTAEMFLIFALDRLDIFSMGDVGLRNAVNRLYNKGRPLNDARTLKLTRQWAPFRSIASWYLWRLTDGDIQTWA